MTKKRIRMPISEKEARERTHRSAYRLPRLHALSHRNRATATVLAEKLTGCLAGNCPAHEGKRAWAVFGCPAICMKAQRRFEREVVPRLSKWISRRGSNPLMTTVVFPELDMSLDEFATFDPYNVCQRIRRGLNDSSRDLDRPIVAIGRVEFKELLAGNDGKRISVTVHLLSVGGNAETYLTRLRPRLLKGTRRIAKPVQSEQIYHMEGALVYVTKRQCDRFSSKDGGERFSIAALRDTQTAFDLYCINKNLIDCIFLFGMRIRYNRYVSIT